MAMNKVDKIWMNGKLVNWDDAKIHVLSHVVHYGSSWFEGIRCYNTAKGSAIFHLDRHVQRLIDSAKMYRAQIPYTKEEIGKAIIDTIRANNLKECYIRPVAYRGYNELGVNPLGCPVDLAIAVWEWGAYLGKDALENGIDVCVSSWRRAAPDTTPTMAKAGGNYLNSQLMKLEALANGYVEGIALDASGHISEGSGENIFIVQEGIIHTTPLISAILPGVTRYSVIALAKSLGIEIREINIPREMLYIAQEVFFTGTAAEISAIRTIDKIVIGEGKSGPVTKRLREAFYDVVHKGNDKFGWLTFI
jgi:branched-chain amino acid aminotransferase